LSLNLNPLPNLDPLDLHRPDRDDWNLDLRNLDLRDLNRRNLNRQDRDGRNPQGRHLLTWKHGRSWHGQELRRQTTLGEGRRKRLLRHELRACVH
jgi:hypothetical protein